MRRFAALPAVMLACWSYEPETGEIRWKQVRCKNGRAIVGNLVGTTVRATTGNTRAYKVIKFDGKDYFAHRIAWFLATGEQPSGLVDHRNGDSLDNRFSNLRLATDSQNQANSFARKSRVLPKGVTVTKSGRYRATIMVNWKQHGLGTHSTADDAAKAYSEAAKTYFGEFARAL